MSLKTREKTDNHKTPNKLNSIASNKKREDGSERFNQIEKDIGLLSTTKRNASDETN